MLNQDSLFCQAQQFHLVAQLEQIICLGQISEPVSTVISEAFNVENLKTLVEASVEFTPAIPIHGQDAEAHP